MERESIRVTRSVSIPLSEIAFRYSRSSGPGGQHAQKSETRVEALFDVEASSALTDRQKNRVVRKAGPVLRAIAQDERSQARNRELAIERDRRRAPGSAPRRAPSGRDEAEQGRGRATTRAEAPPLADEAPSSTASRLNAVDHAAPPVGDEQPALRVDDERERMVEAARKGRDRLRTPARAEVDAHEPPAVPVAQVLAPERDEEVAAPEREPVRGRVRLEVRDRRRHAAAAPRRARASGSSASSAASRRRRPAG